jgi:SAM-dependent methyltransferase
MAKPLPKDRLKNNHLQRLRTEIFFRSWPLDQEICELAGSFSSHSFLANPSGQYAYIYLTQFVKAFSEKHFGRPFSDLSVLDWGCGKGHVSKMVLDLGPRHLDSCDIVSAEADSAFGQEVPIIRRFNISVEPLRHHYLLPYESDILDIVLSVGVLEHVSDEQASLAEIFRVLKPGGLFFCFFLPTKFSWTQQLSRLRGVNYHDRLYTKARVQEMLRTAGLEPLDLWYRQFLPKNSVHYPKFRFFEKLDQFVTERTPLRYLATNIEFVSFKAAPIGRGVGSNRVEVRTAPKRVAEAR